MRYVIDLDTALQKGLNYSKLVFDKEKHRWIDPTKNDPKQQGLFSGEDDGSGGEEGYFNNVRKKTDSFLIKPFLEHVQQIDPNLASRFHQKYSNYKLDQDTKELDLKVDYETIWYMKKIKDDPENFDEYREDYEKATDKMNQQINNRKKGALKLKKGSKVSTPKGEGIVQGFSRRGFPVVKVGNSTEKFFFEELSNEYLAQIGA